LDQGLADAWSPADDEVWLAELEPSLCAHLTTRVDAPARARALVSEWFASFELDRARCDMVRLLVSELVTNAVVHAEEPRQPIIALSARREGDMLFVSVADAGTGAPARRRRPDMSRGGYGLDLVGRAAHRWGVDASQGHRVWFEI
jgi:anti-sigma regulatory factor (Ser/Thr protein kinase)